MPTEWTGVAALGVLPREHRTPTAQGAGPRAIPLPEGPTEDSGNGVTAYMCHVWAVRGGVQAPHHRTPHCPCTAVPCPPHNHGGHCLRAAHTARALPPHCLYYAPSCPYTRPCQCTASPCCPQHCPGTAHSPPVPAHGKGCCLPIWLLVPCQSTAPCTLARTLPTLPAHCLGIAAHPACSLPTHVLLSRQECCSGYGACSLPAHAEL